MSLAFSTSNNIYIRNLAPDVTEDVVRNTFKHCDEILSIKFRSYQGSSRKYCVVEFKTSAGITNGSLMNGKLMLGLPLAISVTDPLLHGSDTSGHLTYGDNGYGPSQNAMAQFQYGAIESSLYNGDLQSKNVSERSVCVGNLPTDYDESDVRSLFGNIGTIVSCSIEPTSYNSAKSAVLEFSRVSEAEEALKLTGISVRDRVLRIEKSKYQVSDRFSTTLPTNSAHYLDNTVIPTSLIEPVRSATINEKLAKVLDMRERLTRKLSSQPTQSSSSNRFRGPESGSNNSNQNNSQWWLEISKRKESRSRNRSNKRERSRSDSHRRSSPKRRRNHSHGQSSSSSIHTDRSHRRHRSSHHRYDRHRSRRSSRNYSRSGSRDKKYRTHRSHRYRGSSSDSNSSTSSR